MAKRRKKSRKTSKRKRGMRGLRGVKGNQVGLFLTNLLAANLAHEGIDYINSLDFMQTVTPKSADGTPGKAAIQFKKIGLGAGVLLAGGAGALMSRNPWANAIGTGIGAGASIYLKDTAVKPALGMGAVEDFLNLYKDGEPLKDLGRPVMLAGIEQNLV